MQTQAFQQWAAPQRIVDAAQVTLDRTAMSVVVIGFSRHAHQGLGDDGLRRRLALLAPHLRRAILIGRTIELTSIEATTFTNAIDGLAVGVFLVDDQSNLIHGNTSGEAMLASCGSFNAAKERYVPAIRRRTARYVTWLPPRDRASRQQREAASF